MKKLCEVEEIKEESYKETFRNTFGRRSRDQTRRTRLR